MNEQQRDDPRTGADQGDARKRMTEPFAFHELPTAEIIQLALQAGLRRQQAEDIAQTVLLKSLADAPSFTGENAADQRRAWFVTVARHEIANVKRERQRHPMLSLEALAIELIDKHGEEPSAADREACIEELHVALRELSERNAISHRLVVGRYFEQRSIKELADAEKLTVSAVSGRLHRALAGLKARLPHNQDE